MSAQQRPIGRPTVPEDLAGYYLTSSLGIGEALGVKTIQRRLARYPINDVLICLSKIAMRADQLILRDVDDAVKMARWLFPARFVDRAVDHLKAHPAATPVSSQAVVNLALHALVACPDEGVAPAATTLTQELGALSLAVAAHLGRDRNDPDSFSVEITRLGLFHTTKDLSSWLDLAALIFLDTIPAMIADEDYVDIDAVMRDTYQIGFERFWALTVLEGIAARETTEAVILPAKLGDASDLNELQRWAGAWGARSLDQTRAAAGRDIEHGTGWSFEAFADYPLTALDNERYIAIRPAWLAAKGSPAGMFWAVRHPLVAAGWSHTRWSQFFGRAVERAGRSLIARSLPTLTVIDEDEIKTWGAGSNCDAILVDDAAADIVAIDFVYRQFTKETAGTGNVDDLAKDLRKAAVNKLEQIDGSLGKGIQGGHLAPSRIYPLVVIGGPFPMSEQLHATVRRLLEARNPIVIGIDGRCQPFTLMDMSSFLALLESANGLGITVPSLLDGWQSSGLAHGTFRDWLVTDGPGFGDAPKTFDWGPRVFAAAGLQPPPGLQA